MNDVDTSDMYCPINGFNPPCGLCMFAVESEQGLVACAIAAIAIKDTKLFVKNIAPRVENVVE